MSEPELVEFQRALGRVIDILTSFQQRLTPRETAILMLGLRASHIEEALMLGDRGRAQAHLDALVKMARELGRSS